MVRILEIMVFLITLLIMYIDVNKKYIPNFLNILLLIVSILMRGFLNIESFIIGAGVYILPMIFIYGYISDLFNKEVLGFGDIKLTLSLGGLLFNEGNSILFQVYIFYLLIFSLATIYILFMCIYNLENNSLKNLRNKELALAPFICTTFLLLYIFKGKII